ncbi:M12 family metallo-peptidase [Idiomarina sp.]|uniref:InlB B-repeat-containing protein n=1 Tax=Idiomarina sp. TaxID=1874361 RepID=UPI002606E2DB|nr:M12 family metallo-peptidase [Idiomarina sp.]
MPSKIIIAAVAFFFSAGAFAQDAAESIERIKSRLQKSADYSLDSLSRLPSNSIQVQPGEVELNNLTLPSGLRINAPLLEKQTDVNGVVTFKGTAPDADVRVNKRGNSSITTVQTDEARWKIITIDGESLIYNDYELPDRIPEDDVIVPDNLPELTLPQPSIQTESTDNTPQTFDAVILYTSATVDYYEGEDLALARIADIVDTTNEIYEDSNAQLVMNLSKTFLIDFDPDNEVPSRDVLYSMEPGDPVFGGAYAYALESGADYLITMRPYVDGDDNCGIAWVGGYNNSEYSADSVMASHTSITCGDYVNAHELGHNMGLAHSLAQGDTGYAFPYARGHGQVNDFVTVMAYDSAYYDEGVSETYPTKTYKFSNPNLDCNGSPCGVDHSQSDGADAARALRIRKEKLTEIRDLTALKDTFVVVNSPYARVQFNQQSSDCSGSCSKDFDEGEQVTVTADALAGFSITGWQGDCTSSQNQCSLETTGLHTLTVEFEEQYVEGVSINEALDNDELSFETEEWQHSWRVDDKESVVGKYSLRSPYLADTTFVSLKTKTVGKGELSFWLKTSFSDSQELEIWLPGWEVKKVPGDQDWTKYTFTIDEDYIAENEISVDFTDNRSGIGGERRFWIDGVTFTPDPDALKPISLNVQGNGTISFDEEYWTQTCRDSCDFYPEPVDGKHTFWVTPDEDHEFLGWGGDCRGTNLECTVSADEYREVYAYFTNETTLDSSAIGDAVDNNDPYFVVRGEAPWKLRNEGSKGRTSVQTGQREKYVAHLLFMWLKGEGTLSFDYKVQLNEETGDYIELTIDGYWRSIGGNTSGWETYSIDLGSGEHIVEWLVNPYGDDNDDGSEYFVAIDNVQWTGEPAARKTIDLNVIGGRGAIRTSNAEYCRDSCEISVGEIEAGETVELYAEANSVAEFVRWEGVCSGSDETCELNVDSIDASTVTAIFENDTRVVTARSSEGGVASPASQDVVVGETAEVTLTPHVGHAIEDAWGCDGSRSGTTYTTAAIFEPCEIVAEFNALEYSVSFDLGEYGEHIGGGALEQSVRWGESAEAPEVRAEDGWHFAGWSDSFSKVTADTSVSAIYQEVEGALRVDLSVSDNASLSLQPVQYIQPGNSLTVTVTPEVGYKVSPTVKGTCPEGEWDKNRYTIASITESCSAEFSATAVLKSGSLLLILSAEGESEDESK